MLCLSMVSTCFPKTTVLMFVWCRAYGCRSGASLSGFDGPIEGLARCALV